MGGQVSTPPRPITEQKLENKPKDLCRGEMGATKKVRTVSIALEDPEICEEPLVMKKIFSETDEVSAENVFTKCLR